MTKRLHPIVLGGLLVGVLDILAAFAYRSGVGGVRSAAVLQAIASGVLGPAAFRGGLRTAALGLALHFVIAFGVAAVYYAASRWWRVLVRQPVVCGMAYGVLVHIFMNQVVLPLSRVNFRTAPWSSVLTMTAIHMLFVGLPAALAVSWSEKQRTRSPAAAAAIPR
jgi:hypothetical protein